MEFIKNLISVYYVEVVMGLAMGLVIIIILNIIQSVRLTKTKKRYNSFISGLSGANIEELLIHIDRDLKELVRDINLMDQKINSLETKQAFAIQKIGFIRYNAFGDMGSELSYSIALLDNFQNGFILSSIYGRENSVSYAKPMKNGKSNIPLSAEEMIAIDRALKGEELAKSL